MKLSVARVDVWIAQMKDAPGMLSDKLLPLSEAGADLDFVFARRSPEKRGTGVVFVAPIKGAKQTKAAKKARFKKSKRLLVLKVSGNNKRGMGAAITEAIADAGISMQGFSAHVLGRKFVLHLAFDSAKDATKAAGILRRL